MPLPMPKVCGWWPQLAILAGVAAIIVLGVALVTLAFAQTELFFSLQARLFGGEDGIQAAPRSSSSLCLGERSVDREMIARPNLLHRA